MADAELFELVATPDGGWSLRSHEHGETFHPGIGPMEEARVLHVAQHRLAARLRAGFVIWDIGLGAGANALAMIEELTALQLRGPVVLHSFDETLEPLRFALRNAEELGYPVRWRAEIAQMLEHGRAEIGPIIWQADLGDFRERVSDQSIPAPEAVMFDPYSPSSNPGMWTEGIFRAIRERAAEDCTLTSYSRSTTIRARLMLAGWMVGKGAATGEKDQTTIASTRMQLLDLPLGRDWLERVSRSNAAGLTDNGGTAQELAAELALCPQMAAC